MASVKVRKQYPAAMPAPELVDRAERARALVRWAFEEREGVSGSPAAAFSGKGKNQTSGLSVRGYTPAGLSSSRVYAVETRRERGSSEPTYSGYLGGNYVRRLIKCLPPDQQDWLTSLYNPTAEMGQRRARLRASLWYKYSEKHIPDGTRSATRANIHSLFHYQLLTACTYSMFCAWQDRRPRGCSDAISPSMWSQRYAQHWRGIREFLVRHDRESLVAVLHGVDAQQSGISARVH